MTLEGDSQVSDPVTFRRKVGSEYPILSDRTLQLLNQFAGAHCCVAVLSTPTGLLEYRPKKRLDLTYDLRSELDVTRPRVSQLSK
jgi:hypothetical protein